MNDEDNVVPFAGKDPTKKTAEKRPSVVRKPVTDAAHISYQIMEQAHRISAALPTSVLPRDLDTKDSEEACADLSDEHILRILTTATDEQIAKHPAYYTAIVNVAFGSNRP